MAHQPHFQLHLICAATLAALSCTSAFAAETPTTELPTTVVTAPSLPVPDSAGIKGLSLQQLPMQTRVVSEDERLDRGIQQLSGLTLLDASTSDSYNAAGYWTGLKVRGFDLDNRYNYRRNGLPINAETALGLSSVAQVDILKGISGMLAGTSSPGGVVNLVTKQADRDRFDVLLHTGERGTVGSAVDWSRRFGAVGRAGSTGLRLNASAESMRPDLHDAPGERHQLALAGDVQVNAGLRIDAELETSRQSQRSQPGMSLLGDQLPSPDALDPRTNLNAQPWALPSVFNNHHASVRVQQQLTADWSATAQLGLQRLNTDDRLAYAYGCSDADGTYWASSYCPDGTYDRYDFRSEGEHRDTDALNLEVQGKQALLGMTHHLTAGVLMSRFKARFGRQAYNWSGQGNVFQDTITPADPSLTDENTQRDERTTEWQLRDTIHLSPTLQAVLGLRHTSLSRASVRTNGSRATDYDQQFSTPWAALTWSPAEQWQTYVSWGQGVESDVTPNRARYLNPGVALPALKSKQWELGMRTQLGPVAVGVSGFDIARPVWRDVGVCDGSLDGACERRADGEARHRGIEASADWAWSGGGLSASWMALDAMRQGSADASLNGLEPVNTPDKSLKLGLRHTVMPGLQLQGAVVHEGRRAVLPDNSLFIPSWTRLDAGVRYQHWLGSQQLTWRLGIDNLADVRAWRESPYQYGHVYLYPLAARTWRASLDWRF